MGVPGLYNLGNTCYANSLLQGLARYLFKCCNFFFNFNIFSSPSIHKWLTNLPMEHIKDGLLDAMREVIQGIFWNPEMAWWFELSLKRLEKVFEKITLYRTCLSFSWKIWTYFSGLNNPEEATLSAVNIATALSQHRWNITIGNFLIRFFKLYFGGTNFKILILILFIDTANSSSCIFRFYSKSSH